MSVNFKNITIGQRYERPELAKIWGYKSFNAISRGVVTPKNTNLIILFVTKEKQDALTQYNDHIVGDILYWEGEERHGSDRRVTEAIKNGDEIHLFFRQRHHSPFVYMGTVTLLHFNLRKTEPSQFQFIINDLVEYTPEREFLPEIASQEVYSVAEQETEYVVESKARRGQDKFRRNLIYHWQSRCSVTGYSGIWALRASHIKPWGVCNNVERLDPYNGLLLVPSLDHLFDCGAITFEDRGRITINPELDNDDIRLLGIHPEMRLTRVSVKTQEYLDFHRQQLFSQFDPSK